ncbi:MAG TPA: sigma-70 family RNA polymerase sigma factor [Bacteroidota bacterium]|nr:sigma-70 family RNA polymerase sigma factor [Bacteroidota bacterium]
MANSDHEIAQRVLGGDHRAFAELIDRHKDRAMTLATRMLKNREDAEEVLQDAFLRVFRALPAFEWKSSFSTWFYRIVFNVCSTALARRNGAAVVSIDEDGGEAAILRNERGPDISFEMAELQSIVGEEIAKLPSLYASVLTLFLVQEMSYDEIAQLTGWPLGTVKVRLFRARTLLREAVVKRIEGQNGSMKIRVPQKEKIV